MIQNVMYRTKHQFLGLMYLRLRWVLAAACGPAPAVASGGCSLVALCGFLTAAVSLLSWNLRLLHRQAHSLPQSPQGGLGLEN